MIYLFSFNDLKWVGIYFVTKKALLPKNLPRISLYPYEVYVLRYHIRNIRYYLYPYKVFLFRYHEPMFKTVFSIWAYSPFSSARTF